MSDLSVTKDDYRRIKSIKESPCYECPVGGKCDAMLEKNPDYISIKYAVYGDKFFDKNNCPMFIALTCPELKELD